MRFIVILALHVALFANSYNFDEYKFVKAVSAEFKNSGHIDVQKDKTVIVYSEPSYKKIIKTDTNVTIEDSSKKLYHLKGRANFYAKTFIGTMTRLGDFSKLKGSSDFDIQKDGNTYFIAFKGDLANQITKAEVYVKDSKVLSFKMFMPNGDTIKIVKK